MREDAMQTSVRDVGIFLEKQAKIGAPITYQKVVERFPDLGPLTEFWRSHPLCSIFGELDAEDHRNGRPFRTALVCAKQTGKPGHGFFETVSPLRNQPISDQNEDEVWVSEFNALR